MKLCRKNYLFTIIFWLLPWNLNAQESRKMLLINPGIGLKNWGFIYTSLDYSYVKNKFWLHTSLGLESRGNETIYEQFSVFYKVLDKKKVKNYVGVSQILSGFIHLKFTVTNRILFKERYYLDLGIGSVYQKNNYDYGFSNSNKTQWGYIASFGYLLPLWKSKNSSTE